MKKVYHNILLWKVLNISNEQSSKTGLNNRYSRINPLFNRRCKFIIYCDYKCIARYVALIAIRNVTW